MVINKIYKREYCMSCKQENPQDREICECGSRNFIFGDGIVYKDGKFKCECGSEEFKFGIHLNMSPIYETVYTCLGCRTTVRTQEYAD